MPIYEFEGKDGARHEEYFPAEKAPRIGAKIRRGRTWWTRIPSGAPQAIQKNYVHVSFSHPLWHPDAPHYDELGRAAFQTKREVMEFQARTAGTNYGLKWDAED